MHDGDLSLKPSCDFFPEPQAVGDCSLTAHRERWSSELPVPLPQQYTRSARVLADPRETDGSWRLVADVFRAWAG